jgi:hypothetical protein
LNTTHNDLLATIGLERRAYLARCMSTVDGRREIATTTTVIDAMLTWSLENISILDFASAVEKDQCSLGFRKRADGNLLWEAYPEGPTSSAKLSFFTRASTYMTPGVEAKLRERFSAELSTSLVKRAGTVIGLPVRALASAERREKLFQFLSSACRDPNHISAS